MKALRYIIGVLLFIPAVTWAQYYDLGQSPASIKWNSIKSKHAKIVFPEYYYGGATRIFRLLDSIRPQVGHGFKYGPMKMPIVLHTQNYNSNGLVLLAPKRMEFIMNPLGAATATPWFKQLAAHEYRHAVHFNNTNRHFIKALSYLLGQQGSLVGGVVLPNWLMEGDAVLAETQMTSFGRGLQPSFTIEYRAMIGEGLKRYTIDKYFCGSYKDYMPDHYQVGYQIASYADTRYNENIWNKVAEFGSKYTYTILTTKFALHKYYRTSVNKLVRATFDDLTSYWNSLPVEHNSAQIVESPITSYTTYSAPMLIDSSTIVAFKKDLDRPDRIVQVDRDSGREQRLIYTGRISSAPVYADGRFYWSEYRNSKTWEQRTHSVLRGYDVAQRRHIAVPQSLSALYPAPMADGVVAYVEYQSRGNYRVVAGEREWQLPDTVSLHGLACDHGSGALYFLATSDAGMWIGRCDTNLKFSVVTRPSYATLSRLKAADGALYFNSIESGKDETYTYDIAADKQYRISTSRYGSFDVMPSEDGASYAMTTYADSKRGYMLSIQPVNSDSLREVAYSEVPSNRINPPRRKWNIINIDKLRVDSMTTTEMPARRYRKGLHLFSVHSWAPMGFDPSEIISENNFRIHAGATVMSQNLLASTVTQLGYAWTDKGSQLAGKISYRGLAPKFSMEFVWGGADQYVSIGAIHDSVKRLPKLGSKLRKNLEIQASVSLPITLSSGYVTRTITPSVDYYYDNSILLRRDLQGYSRNGLQRLSTSLYYSENVRMASRDILPRLGYAARVSYLLNPVRDDFGSIWSLYMRGYLPGVAIHHSLMLRTSLQYQNLDFYNYRRKELFPRGADYEYTAQRYMSFAADYQLPLCYPDVGLTSILYVKRIRMNLTADYARLRSVRKEFHTVWSYGAELHFDISPLQLPPSTSTSISISIFKPNNRPGVVIQGGLSLPI